MNQSDAEYANQRIAQLKSEYGIDIAADWKDDSGAWQPGTWTREELDKLYNIVSCLADCIGGPQKLKENTGGVTIRKADIGTHGGEADKHRISLSTKVPFTGWTLVHELAHSWDANNGWELSRKLEKHTGGFTNLILAWILKQFGKPDLLNRAYDRTAGHYGRLPGCNAYGYFYGDKPGGSDWNFNRKEDFAESVAMYVGWERNNDLSEHARNRIVRYKLEDGDKDGFGVNDNWKSYSKYFYPENGDYAKTKRWQFVDDLVNGR